MNYEGGFTKLRIKYETQKQVSAYEVLRQSFLNIADENANTFETSAIELEFLDNNSLQLEIFNSIHKTIEDSDFTLITKEELLNYIINLEYFITTDNFRKQYIDVEKTFNIIKKEIAKLKDLYVTFDWENDTLLFDYICKK